MFGPLRLILHHGWLGVSAAPEILSRPASLTRDSVPVAPFHVIYRSPSARLSVRGGDDGDYDGSLGLGILLLAL